VKTRNHKRSSELRFNMTPLIDVTFLLIIFAVLISHFVQQEGRLLRLPKADQAREKKEDSHQKLIITIPRAGIAMINGKPHSLRDLEKVFREELTKNPRLSIQLRADGDMSYKNIQQIMLRCAQAGIWQVSFAVDKKSEPLGTKNYKDDKEN
jgi:biopolymer transport protein ExbD